MTKIDRLWSEIQTLSESEQLVLFNRLQSQVEKRTDIKSTLNKYQGRGGGVWAEDAQDFVNEQGSKERTDYECS